MREYVVATWGWDEEWQEREFRKRFPLESREVIRRGDVDIGCIRVEDRDDHVHLAYVALLPAHQGQGIGSLLVRDLCRDAANHGKPVRLTVLQANPARALYERLGFRVTETVDPRVHMEWRLDGPR